MERIVKRLLDRMPLERESALVRLAANMKVLLLSWNFPPTLGGIEYVVGNTFAGLRRAGHPVQVITGAADAPAQDGVHRPRRGGLLTYLGFAFFRGWALCRAERPDVIVCGTVVPAPAAWLLALRYRRPVIILVHGSDVVYENWLYRRASRFLFRRARRLTANSHHTRGLLEEAGLPCGRIEVVHPGVDVRAFETEPERGAEALLESLQGRNVLLSVGRLIRRKGLLEFVRDVLPGLVQRDPNLSLVLVGDDATASLAHGERMRARIERAAQEAGLGAHVILTGTLPDAEVVRLFYRADLFVLPCLKLPGDVEGFGIVFLEAALAGTASVATRVGGIPDAVIDGETGLLVEPGDPSAFGEAVFRLLEDVPLRERLARTGAERARAEFSWDAITAQYIQVFEKCLP
jgi:phosphatidylinositol alpha-1,6-mannosyltransferase